MKIAQVAPLYESVPPRLYGGTERVVAHLCNALTDLGHEVTLFASADSKTSATLVPARGEAIRLDASALKSDLAAHLCMLADIKRREHHFDILHFHIDMLHFALFEQHAARTVTTLHGRLDMKDLPDVYKRWPHYGLVSISNEQRRPLPDAHWLTTISHGLPANLYEFTEQPRGNYLAYLGRIAPEKRPELAIDLACRADLPLRIAAKVDNQDVCYFEAVVKPLLSHPLIEFIGEIGDDRKSDFLGNARALLFPVNWPEPFGLVMIEAMACGTPVIAWNRGSVSEVIEHGRTGFIVETETEAMRAIAQAHRLDRRQIRETFERRFTATVMARAYADVYSRLLHAQPFARIAIAT